MTGTEIGLAAFVGVASGADAAIWGMYKDAAHDWRSPALTVLFAVLLFPLTGNAMLAGIAAIGYERAASENYKTFFFPSRPRGKFAGKPIAFPSMLRVRHRFVPAYAAIRIGMLWLVADVAITGNVCFARCCETTSTHAQSALCQ